MTTAKHPSCARRVDDPLCSGLTVSCSLCGQEATAGGGEGESVNRHRLLGKVPACLPGAPAWTVWRGAARSEHGVRDAHSFVVVTQKVSTDFAVVGMMLTHWRAAALRSCFCERLNGFTKGRGDIAKMWKRVGAKLEFIR